MGGAHRSGIFFSVGVGVGQQLVVADNANPKKKSRPGLPGSGPSLPLTHPDGLTDSWTEKSKAERNIISNTWDMLGKRKERATNSPTPNLKNEGDISAPRPGYTVARQLVLEELDLEIRVRKRLKETIESRIGWATCLQTSLNVVRENQGASVFQQ